MNKKQLIQQLKYTKEKHKNDKLFTFDTDISAMCSDVLDVLSRCVEIPDNATNGDVLSSIFNIDIKNKLVHDDINAYEITVDLGTNWTTLRINKDWWNTLYK